MVLKFTVASIVPITTSIQLLPQLYKTYNTKSVEDISFYSLIIILMNNILWLIHGYFIFDYSLILSGILSFIINIVLCILYMLYSDTLL